MKTTFRVLMKRQHLELMEGSYAELDMGLTYELVKRGVCEVDPLDRARYSEYASTIKEGPSEDLLERRSAHQKAYDQRIRTERITKPANAREVAGERRIRLRHVQSPV